MLKFLFLVLVLPALGNENDEMEEATLLQARENSKELGNKLQAYSSVDVSGADDHSDVSGADDDSDSSGADAVSNEWKWGEWRCMVDGTTNTYQKRLLYNNDGHLIRSYWHRKIRGECRIPDECPLVIVMSGADAQQGRMGKYTRTDMRQGDRPIYHQENNGQYLYYWPSWNAWRIGSRYNSASSGIISKDHMKRQCPTDVTDWYQWNRGWKHTATISCKEA
jgi:hypothetical protein